MLRISILAILAMASTVHAESAIYKCTKPDGSVVFAPTPCGSNAKTLVAPKPAGASTTSTPQPKAQSPVTNNSAIQDIHDSVEDSRCRDEAHALYREPDKSAKARAEDEMHMLENRQWRGPNAANVQILTEQDKARIASLRALISSEQARIETAQTDSRRRVDEALAKCDEAKSNRANARSSASP